MYAIIKTGGKQYKVAEGSEIIIEKLNAEEGASVTFEEVLAVGEGDEIKFGRPLIEGAKVTGSVVKNGKGPKIRIFKYKHKTNYRRRQGHRQPFTKVKIEKIESRLSRKFTSKTTERLSAFRSTGIPIKTSTATIFTARQRR